MEAAASLILRWMENDAAAHDRGALASLIAFAAYDLRACRAYLKALCSAPKG